MNTLQRIQKAITAKKINELSDAELTLLITKVQKLVSAPKELDLESLKIIASGFRRNYQNYSAQEIIIAMELFSDDRLNLENHEHFGIIDWKFLNRIIKAYKNKFRGEAMINSRKKDSLKLQEVNPVPFEQSIKEDFQFVVKWYIAHDELASGTHYTGAFKYAEKIGAIKLTREQKLQILEDYKKKLKHMIHKDKSEGSIKTSIHIETLKSPERIATDCGVHYMKNWIKTQEKEYLQTLIKT